MARGSGFKVQSVPQLVGSAEATRMAIHQGEAGDIPAARRRRVSNTCTPSTGL